MSAIGLVFIDMLGVGTISRDLIKDAMEKTPAGRNLVILYDLPSKWGESPTTESDLVREILGPPVERTNEFEWEFSGAVVVRFCNEKVDDRSVDSESALAIFRRTGEKAYKRRKDADPKIIEKSKLESLHPVFTRDLANNVWHLKANEKSQRVISRLGPLLAWSDEKILVFAANKEETFLKNGQLNLSDDLIGVARKLSYDGFS
jgi:hypothetical protein